MKLLLICFLLCVQTQTLFSREWKTNLAWQIALEENNFSTGLLDGIWGEKSDKALREYLAANEIPYVNSWDTNDDLKTLLGVKEDQYVLKEYIVTNEDNNSLIVLPETWEEKSELSYLGYETLDELIQNKFKCSKKGLRRFNPNLEMDNIQAGTVVMVPNVGCYKPLMIDSITIDLCQKELSAYDFQGKKIFFTYCSVAKLNSNLPTRNTKIINKVLNPNYTYTSRYRSDFDGSEKRYLINPGPKNPVGIAWLGLDLPGYGIHGTPDPDSIRKTGSLGCIRLTNWHAKHLALNTCVGMMVKMIGFEMDRS